MGRRRSFSCLPDCLFWRSLLENLLGKRKPYLMNRTKTMLLFVLASLPSIVVIILILHTRREPAGPVIQLLPAPVTATKPQPVPSEPAQPSVAPSPSPQKRVVNVLPASVTVVTPPPVKTEPKQPTPVRP